MVPGVSPLVAATGVMSTPAQLNYDAGTNVMTAVQLAKRSDL
jgi:hypothetical protein